MIVMMLALSAATADLRTIPLRFQGHWAMTIEQCTADLADDTNIRVGADFIHDYTGRMIVNSASPSGGDMIIASVRVGTGADAYDNAKRLELYDKGKSLAVGEGEDHANYVRCKS